MELNELLEQTHSKSTFLRFVEALRADKQDEERKEKKKRSSPYGPGHNGWQNSDIVTFLEALEAFGHDSSAIDEQPTWETFALLLYAGKFYE